MKPLLHSYKWRILNTTFVFSKTILQRKQCCVWPTSRDFLSYSKKHWISSHIYTGYSPPLPIYIPLEDPYMSKSEVSPSSTLLRHWILLLFLTVQVGYSWGSWTKITQDVWDIWEWTDTLISKSCSLHQQLNKKEKHTQKNTHNKKPHTFIVLVNQVAISSIDYFLLATTQHCE